MYVRSEAVGGINPSKSSQTNKTSDVKNDSEVSIFNENEVDKSDVAGKVISTIIISILDEVFSDGAFTKDEAKIYVDGEKEIAALIEKEKSGKGFFDLLFNSSNIEKECRKKYEQEHPEYAAVAKEGQKVQKQHDEALAKAKEAWLELNPKPENITEEGGFFGIKRTEEYKQWAADSEAFIKEFEKEYKKKDPDYQRLSDEQYKDKSYADELIAELFSSFLDEVI